MYERSRIELSVNEVCITLKIEMVIFLLGVSPKEYKLLKSLES